MKTSVYNNVPQLFSTNNEVAIC